MKAVIMTAYGNASCLEIQDVEKPMIGENEIFVRVMGSSVNPVDCKVRQGDVKFISGRKVPRRIGSDYSGIVEEVGRNVKSVKSEDEVFGMVRAFTGDAYAEFITVTEDQIALKPKNLNFIEAGVMPLVGLTIYQLFFEVARVSYGSKIMINGCSGGIGHIAVQVAKSLNCDITGVCSTKNIEYAKSIGVNHVIDYLKENILAHESRYDLFFDAVANLTYKQAKHTLTLKGQYVSSIPSFQNMILAPILNLISTKKHKKVWVMPDAKNLKALCGLIEDGKIFPTIERIYPIEEVADAHRHSETGRVVGKIALSF